MKKFMAVLMSACFAFGALTITGCGDKKGDETPAADAGAAAGDAVKDAGAAAGDAVKDAGAAAGDAIKKAGDAAK